MTKNDENNDSEESQNPMSVGDAMMSMVHGQNWDKIKEQRERQDRIKTRVTSIITVMFCVVTVFTMCAIVIGIAVGLLFFVAWAVSAIYGMV